MNTTPEVPSSIEAWADVLATEFGETGAPRRDLRRLARLVGSASFEAIVRETRLAVASGAPETLRADGSPRTPGGIFFRVAKGHVKRRIGDLKAARERGETVDLDEKGRLYQALQIFHKGDVAA